jgi:hypothetical protein
MAHNNINNYLQKLGTPSNEHHGILKRYNYIFNSNSGVLLSPPNKARFSVNFTTTIKFPEDATSIQVGLHSANIKNIVPNVVTGLYDTLTFIQDGITRTITIPQGSYDACDLQLTINELLAEAYSVPPGLEIPEIVFLANNATQTLSIQFVKAGGAINWGASTIGFVLGFDTNDTQPASPPGSTAGGIITGDAIARFDWPVTNFLITCADLVGDGLPLNSVGFGIVGAVPIQAQPGSLITYEARNPLYIQCDHLIGQSVSSLTFELTNERAELIQMGEDFNFTLVMKIEY